MSVKYEELEHNLVKMTIEIPLEKISEAEDAVYKKVRGNITLPGFRKGKATRTMIEHAYGKGCFLEDAVNDLLPYAYEEAVAEVEKEHDIKITSYPELTYDQVEVGKPVIFTATAAKRPEVKLGEYKNLETDVKKGRVTAKDIDAALEQERMKNSTMVPVEDRAAADGDSVTIDFLGKVDGVAFEGGEGKDYTLTIGSHTFIEGFEEQMIGMNIDETKDIEVTFPAEYHAAELAGQPAVFTVTMKGIKTRELPELDDEFASEVSDFETLDEYKADLKKQLAAKKDEEYKRAKEDALMDKIIENSEIDIPELMIKSEAQNSVREYAEQLKSQGLSLEQYLQYTGQSEQQLVEQQMEVSKKQIAYRLTLEAIVKAENIEATDEDLDKKLKEYAEMYKMEEDKIRELFGEAGLASIKADLATAKALDFIVEQSK